MPKTLVESDYIGKRYGKLTILSLLESIPESVSGKRTNRKCLCECDCGNTKEILIGSLKSGKTHSCGCVKDEKTSRRFSTHKLTGSNLYKIYHGIKSRCYNKNQNCYKYYGGKNVTMCEGWLSDIQAFYDWSMNNGYEDGLTLDRKDVNGNYEPDNCEWVTRTKQMHNTRKIYAHNKSGIKGVYKHGASKKWAAQIGMNGKIIRLGYFDTIEEADKARKQAENKHWK